MERRQAPGFVFKGIYYVRLMEVARTVVCGLGKCSLENSVDTVGGFMIPRETTAAARRAGKTRRQTTVAKKKPPAALDWPLGRAKKGAGLGQASFSRFLGRTRVGKVDSNPKMRGCAAGPGLASKGPAPMHARRTAAMCNLHPNGVS